jgi:hypothetical protein
MILFRQPSYRSTLQIVARCTSEADRQYPRDDSAYNKKPAVPLGPRPFPKSSVRALYDHEISVHIKDINRNTGRSFQKQNIHAEYIGCKLGLYSLMPGDGTANRKA